MGDLIVAVILAAAALAVPGRVGWRELRDMLQHKETE